MTDQKQEQGEEQPSIISKKSGTHHPCPNDVTKTHDQGMQRNPGDVNLEKYLSSSMGVIIPLLWLILKKNNGELQQLAKPSICGFCRLTRFSMASGKFPFESTTRCLM